MPDYSDETATDATTDATVTDATVTDPTATDPTATDATIDQPVGRLRLLPSVTFGVRASALTRVALPVAMVTAGLLAAGPAGGAQNLITMDTTCCPPQL